MNAEISADRMNDEDGPAGVDGGGEDEVGLEVAEFGERGGTEGRGRVDEEGAEEERGEEDGPVGEGLAGQVGEDDFGGHAAEDEGHGEAEEGEVIVSEEVRVWGEEPAADGERVDGHGRPFEEDGRHGQTALSTGPHDVGDAEGQVREEKGAGQDRDEDVPRRAFAQQVAVARQIRDGSVPDLRSVIARDEHHRARKDQSLCGDEIKKKHINC